MSTMDSESEFLKEWDLVSSDSIGNVENDNRQEESKTECSTEVAKTENIVDNSGVQDINQEAAHNDSSSSDIDVIDENIEECVTNCVLPSSSLSITPSTPTLERSSSSSTEISSMFTAPEPEHINTADNTRESDAPGSQDADITDFDRRTDDPYDPWTIGGRPIYEWLCLALEFLRNMSEAEWGVVFALTMLLYINIHIHQTNTIGLEKEEVLSQMRKLVDELKNDNKMLKSQMMAEIQNDKVISSFEHQIRELRKENSKLNFMLRDVASVLQTKLDSREKLHGKKQAEYQAPLKKEINKLKDHINFLKFDNEELQKQLVRMRYASYSQGEKNSDDKDKKEKKENQGSEHIENNENKETVNDIHLEIKHLKKWNELVTQLAKELGVSDEEQQPEETAHTEEQKTSSKTEFKYDWGWKLLKKNLKIPNVNISDIISKYVKANVQTMANVYDTVNTYFNSAQEALKSSREADEETEMLKFFNTLQKYWSHIKGCYFKSLIKKVFQPTDEDTKSPEFTKNLHAKSDYQGSKEEFKTESEELDKKVDPQQLKDNEQDLDESKWVFERAEYRAKLRNEDESSINWFLRRGKELFQGRPLEEENNEDVLAEE